MSVARGRWIAVLFLLPSMALASNVINGDHVTPQQYPFEKCRTYDKACMRAWFSEYKQGLIEEFEHYRSLESLACSLASKGEDAAAYELLKQLARDGYYRHVQWNYPKDPAAIANTGIALDDWNTVTEDCRTAILAMKFYLIATADSRKDNEGVFGFYKESAEKCSKRYKLEEVSARSQ